MLDRIIQMTTAWGMGMHCKVGDCFADPYMVPLRKLCIALLATLKSIKTKPEASVIPQEIYRYFSTCQTLEERRDSLIEEWTFVPSTVMHIPSMGQFEEKKIVEPPCHATRSLPSYLKNVKLVH